MIHKLPLYWYDHGDHTRRLQTNISRSIFVESIDKTKLTRYRIKSNETLYEISTRLYGIPDYFWIIAQLNNIQYPDLRHLMTDLEFDEKMSKPLPNGESPLLSIHHYENNRGVYYTLDAITNLKYQQPRDELSIMNDFGLKAVSVYEHEKRNHERKKIIYVPTKVEIDMIMDKVNTIVFTPSS